MLYGGGGSRYNLDVNFGFPFAHAGSHVPFFNATNFLPIEKCFYLLAHCQIRTHASCEVGDANLVMFPK